MRRSFSWPLKHLSSRLSFSQFASGSVSGVFIPLFGAWLAWRGLSPAAIGTLLSTALMLRALAGPVSGIIADARNDRRLVMLSLYWVMLAGFGALNAVTSPLLIFLAAVPAYVAYGAATPLLESVSVRLSEHFGFDYGRVRIWASSAFVVMNVSSGILARYFGLMVVAPLLTLGALACVVSTTALPSPPVNEQRAPLRQRFKANWEETRELMRSGVFLIFLAAASFEQSTHAFYYGYGGLHWHHLHYSEMLIGIIWPLGVLAEIALFSQATRVLKYFGPVKLLAMGGIVCVIRWTILAFDPSLPLVIFAQFLHGGTFALAHLGAVFFIMKAVPPRLAATAQSLYFMGSQGVMMGVMTLASGYAYPVLGGQSYLLMAGMGVVAIAVTMLLGRHWRGGRIIYGEHDNQAVTI
jgi:MFS transporter, PPP family, 3-phenylpropionic acid transporter